MSADPSCWRELCLLAAGCTAFVALVYVHGRLLNTDPRTIDRGDPK